MKDQQYFVLDSGEQKTELIRQLAIFGAIHETLVRETAIALVRGLPRSAHYARIERLHQFVRDSIDYVREPVEMLHPATVTLAMGAGDCDDHVILLGALAWSIKYPFIVEAIGDQSNPHHYTMAIGYPQTEEPTGDADTTWIATETTARAMTGEHVDDAMRRLGAHAL